MKLLLLSTEQICIQNNIHVDMELSTILEYKEADIILLSPQLAYAKAAFIKRYPKGILILIQHYDFASLQPKHVVHSILQLINHRKMYRGLSIHFSIV